MEFPDLGENCSEPTCKRLDFLPVKCDACKNIFCKDHMSYVAHSCDSAYKKDVQVPVCPLCNVPIPITRGDPPDIAVGAHIDTQCQSVPAKDRRKAYINKCSLKGCRTKELIPLVCNECTLNFCLKHRHASDHKCGGRVAAQRERLAKAAAARAKQSSGSSNTSARGPVHSSAIQGNMSEDEALARALQLSMQESNGNVNYSDHQPQATTRARQWSQDRCSLS